jgi:predicted lipoprotein with Yx(FWY)xxD motif
MTAEVTMPTTDAPVLTADPAKAGTRARTVGRVAAAALAAALAFGLLAGPAGARSTTTVATAKVSGVGRVLVDGDGMTLYTLTDASGDPVDCTGACLQAWPALTVVAGEKATAPKSVKGVSATADGAVTYKKKPLYTFAGDTKAGQAKGNNLSSFGGTWKVVSVKAKPTTTAPGRSSGYSY